MDQQEEIPIDHAKSAHSTNFAHFRKPRFITRLSKPWNDRFHVMTTKDNPKLHIFYKELFGKPSHVKHEDVLLMDKGKPSYLFGSSYTPFIGDKMSKTMRKTLSQEQLKFNNSKEHKWVSNFNVMGSKNNDRVHRHFKEYFDRPVDYDNQGYGTGIGRFGEIYDRLSPEKMEKMSQTLKNKSLGILRKRVHNSNSYGADDINRAPESVNQDPNTITEGNNENNDEVKSTKKSIHDAVKMQRSHKKKRINFRRSLERIQKEPDYAVFGSIPNLRKTRISPSDRKKEYAWKRIGEQISTYNELVHPAFKIGFERL